MTYFEKLKANNNLSKGVLPFMKKIDSFVYAGYGDFDCSSKSFDIPVLFEETENGNISFLEWDLKENREIEIKIIIDNVEKKYYQYNLFDIPNIINQLPFFLCEHKIKEKILNNKPFLHKEGSNTISFSSQLSK